MLPRLRKRSWLLLLTAAVCFSCKPTKQDLRSSGDGDAASDGDQDEFELTTEVRESVAALLGDTVSFVKDFEIQVIQCDPNNSKTAHVLVKTATKAQLDAGEVRISKQMKNLKVLISKLKVEATGAAGELFPDIGSGVSLCTAFESFKASGLQLYNTSPVSALTARVQNEKNLAGSIDFGVNKVPVSFDVALQTQSDISQVDVVVDEAARNVDSLVSGTSPTAFSVDKASIVNKSALTDNACVFQLTLKCTSKPVIVNGKMTSCAGIELAKNPWRLSETSGAAPVKEAQPSGSPNPLNNAAVAGTDSIVLPFSFACSRGKAGVSTEKKKFALEIWNKLGCDADSSGVQQCGRQTFTFPISLTYRLP